MDKDFSKYYKITDKEFWRNYWFYYRVHTIVGVIVAALIIGTVVSFVTRVNPDILIMHIGGGLFDEEWIPDMEAYAAEKTPDINEDGKQVVSFQTLIYNESLDAQMALASMTKADLEFAGGDSTLVLVDETTMARYINMEVFQDLTDYVQQLNIAPERLKYSEDGSRPLLVNITNTRFVAEGGYQGPDLYLGLRVIPQSMQKKKIMLDRAEASKQLFENIITDDTIVSKKHGI